MGYNSKLLGQDKGHSAVSDLETTRFQNIDEFISDPTECFVAMREKLDASFSKNCDLNHKIDQMEDRHGQESKKLKSRVKKLEATVDGLRQEIEEEKRNKNKKLTFREQALANAEKALEQRKQELDSAESELAAVTTAESSTDSWDKETDDNGSTIFGDARISEGVHAVEQNSMFADNWDNGDRVVDAPADRIEARCASPIKDIDAELPTTPGALSWKLILVFLLLLAVRVAVIVYPTVSEQNPPTYQHLPDTCHMSDKPTALALPDPLPILVCLSDKSSNATQPPASILMFDSAKYSHNLPQLEES
jgi:hypothetical protein